MAQPSAYQRVTSTYDVTEAGKADKWHLVFDGVDDFMETPSIDFTGTDEMSVFAGVRKLSDATLGILVELSSGVANGRFNIHAPLSSDDYRWFSRGETNSSVDPAGFAAPTTNILTGWADISEDLCVLRIDGSLIGSSVTDQGAGNYGNYPLYIGARSGLSFFFYGHIYSHIVRGKLSTDAEIANTENHVANKTGVTL